ncbi:MATE family efflux transporter, partial [Hamadaea sp. NPDC051192]|uniref:MATE family efflux transporter n=1 Tax=Hamadaea sp. NPDC051192 TaxID=3154940 RepID=UPI003443CE58
IPPRTQHRNHKHRYSHIDPITGSTFHVTPLAASAMSYPAFAAVEATAAVMRGVGRTARALCLTVTVNGGYLLLAAGLVQGLDLGVRGLAYALVMSRYLTAGMALWVVRRDGVLGRRWAESIDWTAVRRVAVIGVPFVAEQLFFNGGKLLTQTFVVSMGTLEITANAVAQSLVALSEIVPQALCIALVPIVGQAIGAGRPDDARRLIRSFLWLSTGVAAVTVAAMLAGFPWLLDVTRTPPQVADDVAAVFLMASAARLLGWWSLSYLLAAGLRAAGDAVYTTAVATVTMVLRVALIWIVGVHLEYGVVGVWGVMVAEWGLRSAVFARRFRGSRWESRSFVTARDPALPGCP